MTKLTEILPGIWCVEVEADAKEIDVEGNCLFYKAAFVGFNCVGTMKALPPGEWQLLGTVSKEDISFDVSEVVAKSESDFEISMFKKYWYDRNPVHERNADSHEDMFWATAEMVAREYCAWLNKHQQPSQPNVGSDEEIVYVPVSVELVNAYEDYIKLLGEEISDLMGLAMVHGIFETSRVKAGEQCRKTISELKAVSKPVPDEEIEEIEAMAQDAWEKEPHQDMDLFCDTFIKGAKAIRNKAALSKGGARWVIGEYEKLYQQVDAGKRIPAYVDYNFRGSMSKPCRDICTIRNLNWEFSARGIGYSGLFGGKPTLEDFIQECETLNVEWLDDESHMQLGEVDWSDEKRFTNQQVMEMLSEFAQNCSKSKYNDIPNDAAEYISDKSKSPNNIAIPVQKYDEAGLWDEVWADIVDVLYDLKNERNDKSNILIEKLKSKYEIKRKQ